MRLGILPQFRSAPQAKRPQSHSSVRFCQKQPLLISVFSASIEPLDARPATQPRLVIGHSSNPLFERKGAEANEIHTPALCGLRAGSSFLHEGSASAQERAALLTFLGSL